MPVYQNDSTTETIAVRDTNDKLQQVRPAGTVTTFEDLSGDSRFSVSSAAPATSAAVAAQNTWTGGVKVNKTSRKINVSVSGTFVATVTLQRSTDGESTWQDVATYSAAAEAVIEDAVNDTVYRIGVATGDYTSGTANVELTR